MRKFKELSESVGEHPYRVRYWYENDEGYERKAESYFEGTGKTNGDAVYRYFKVKYPKRRIIEVSYCG